MSPATVVKQFEAIPVAQPQPGKAVTPQLYMLEKIILKSRAESWARGVPPQFDFWFVCRAKFRFGKPGSCAVLCCAVLCCAVLCCAMATGFI